MEIKQKKKKKKKKKKVFLHNNENFRKGCNKASILRFPKTIVNTIK